MIVTAGFGEIKKASSRQQRKVLTNAQISCYYSTEQRRSYIGLTVCPVVI